MIHSSPYLTIEGTMNIIFDNVLQLLSVINLANTSCIM